MTVIMTVSQDDLEGALAQLRRQVPSPEQGIWGPGTVAWMVTRELVTFLAGGRAILLQLAHPFVASGIDQHSSTKHDPIGRFRRTFRYVYAMAFGDLDHACEAARRVHRIHQRIHGTIGERVGPYDANSPYDANDEEALLWVHATLFEGAVCAFESILRPLSVAEGRMVFPFMDMSDLSQDPLGGLTAREQELLSSLAQGCTNAQISGELGISLNTVKFHLKNLYGKLNVRNRAQAVARYLKVGRGG